MLKNFVLETPLKILHKFIFQLRAAVIYSDPVTSNISGVLMFNVLGLGEEWSRKLIRDARPVKRETLKDYAKLFDFWEYENGPKGTEEKGITEDELEAYQRRED